MSIELVMPSNHLILCYHLLLLPSIFPSISVFQWAVFASGDQSTRASASASVLPMNIQGWFPLGFTGLISLLSKGLWRAFYRTTVQKHQLFGAQSSSFFFSRPSFWSNSHIHIWLLENPQLWLDEPLLAKSLLFNMLSMLVIAFLPRSKCLLISWVKSPSAVIL